MKTAGDKRMKVKTWLAAAAAFTLLFAGCGGGDDSTPAVAPPGAFQVTTLSSRPDLVTGGSALVQVTYPVDVTVANVKVTLNGADVTSQLATSDPAKRTLQGVVTGLTTASTGSANALIVSSTANPAQAASLTLVNYPITGPVLSGPHISPYECRTVQNGLGNPLDGDCSAVTQVAYFYRASNNTFKALVDPTAPRPADLVTTTTNDGTTVPYIVRVESGTINRGVYNLAILDNPALGVPVATTFVPGAGWNKKLVLSFNCCGSASFNQGVLANTTALSHTELSRGFAFMNSTEMWNNQHANPHLQGETAMMVKEYFIKHVGLPKWTVGTGGSGGAIQQYLVAQLYPGVLDGLQPTVSFPETFMPNVYECRLVNSVFKADPARWTTAKQVAIQGFNAGTCNSWDLSFASPLIRADYAPGCSVTDPANIARLYNATTNPTGNLFCDFFETNVNLLGKDQSGRARRPADNVGVQYGLGALNAGTITTTEFLDFNQLVGGFDRDGYGPTLAAGPVTPGLPNARHVADLEAVRLSYAGGFKNSFTGLGLANIPIITQRGNASGTGDIHDTMQDLIIRARLQRANGRSDNQAIFTSSTQAATAGFDLAGKSIDVINAWLDNIAADPAPPSTAKVVANKPSTGTQAGLAVDACWDKSGVRIAEAASTSPTAACNVIYPRFSTLRLQAGEALVQDGLKCQLKPIVSADYAVTFSNAELVRLNQIFPAGVCDWTKPSVNQVPLAGTYLHLPIN
jgi:hypothetical protein